MTTAHIDHREAIDLSLLRETVVTLLSRAGGVERSRTARDSGGDFDNALWSQLAEAGILGVAIGEAAGGIDLGLTAAGVIAEELGRHITPEPFGPVAILAGGLVQRLAPTHPILRRIVTGETIPAPAWQERSATGVSNEVATRTTNGKITGSKAWVISATDADVILTTAMDGSDLVLCEVSKDADGLTIDPVRRTDGSHLSGVTFNNTPADVLASGPELPIALAAAIDDATAIAAAEMLGVLSKAYELTLDYLKTRKQFGKPIGSFQALQHRAVDMHIALEIATAGIHDAIRTMDATDDPDERARQASRAKARAGEAARVVSRESIQMHGAIGYTDEYDIGLFLNRTLALSAWLGDAAFHRRRWLDLSIGDGLAG